jgi:outer membrane protein OmpA-like peptidoglycan-associated protein
MKKWLVPATALSLLVSGGAIARATDYPFTTGMAVTIEKGEMPTYEVGSNRVYQIVSYFTANFPNGDDQFVLTKENGEVLTVMKEGDRYYVDADVPINEKVYFGPDEQNVGEPIRVLLQGPINIGHVHFAVGSSRLSLSAKEALQIVAQEMAAHNLASAYLVGMTDRTGNASANVALSSKRASVTAAYLTAELSSLGVEDPQITTEGMGEYLSTNKDGTTNPYDRKVSILLYPKV